MTEKRTSNGKNAKEVPVKKCLRPECHKHAISRGLCWTCYASCRRLILQGKTTDESLVKAGKLLPLKRGGTNTAAATKWFLEEQDRTAEK